MKATGAIQISDGVFRALVAYTRNGVRVWTNIGQWTTERAKAEREMNKLIALAN